MITVVLGAPGSGKSTVAGLLAGLLPGHVVLDWDAFMAAAATLAGREIRADPATWPGYRMLMRTILEAVAHLPVVLLGVCTPAELEGWPADAWILLDCTDQERLRRLGDGAEPDRVRDGLADGRAYRLLNLPVVDSTGRSPAEVAADLAAMCAAGPERGRGRR